nr:FAD-dependent monooxygenase [Nakamurella flavida]
MVVGAGPAGLAAALHARARGLRVAVLDPRVAPIDKACGEGLMPGALAGLRGLGVTVTGQPIAGIRYLASGSCAEARFRAGPGAGVRRTDLAAALSTAAQDRGVQVHRATAGPVTQDADGVTVAGIRARYLIAADGLHSPVRRGLGLDAPVRGAPRWGLRRHFPVAPWTDLVEVHWSRHAEAYVTPVGPGQVGVAVLSGVRGSFDDHLAAFASLADRLAGVPGTPVRGAGPLRQRARRRVAGRVLLVGDAAGYVDALTGEGIAVALAGAAAAVDCLARDRPQEYEAAWTAATRRYRWLTAGLLAASRVTPVRRALVPAASALPAVFGGVVDALAGHSDGGRTTSARTRWHHLEGAR